MFEATFTNESNSRHEVFALGSLFWNQIAIRDDRGNILHFIHGGPFMLLAGGGWDPSESGTFREIIFEPYETKTIRWMFIVPDFALDDPTLFLWLNPGEKHVEGIKLDFE